MRKQYDFSKATRGAVVTVSSNKARITIRLDHAVLEWFKDKADAEGGANYQTLINTALLEHIRREKEPLEKILRRVIRDELRRAG